ncbi:complement C1q tumor necrosis factor-related protein 3-like isoform X2 [Dunckerocampus dactyliophorus]|nr:complement C1q tumor necrosis factor-related protein 3-like isoform X2 [Dunckerocampus dactyliophorus]
MFLFIAIEVGWIPLPSWLWTTRMDRLEQDIQVLTGKMTTQDHAEKDVTGRMNDHLKAAETTNKTIKDLTGRMNDLTTANNKTIQDLKARVGKLDGMSDKRKVWFAATGGDKKTNDSKVIFQNVDTNMGSHYDATTGIFTAPYKGAYFFTVTFRSDGGMIELDVFREKMDGNQESLMSLYDSTNTKGKISIASNSKMVDLEDGDKVYVRASSSHELTCCANVFSGFLVYPM